MATFNITQKQKEILLLLYRFRFLTTNHIQKLLNHKNPKRTQAWLKDLKDKGYIGMIFARDKRSENTKPAIYYLATKSRNILKKEEDCNTKVLERVYKEGKRSEKFIDHCLCIAAIYLFFLKQKETHERLHFFTKTELYGYDYFLDELPDAYIAIKGKSRTKRFFLDLFDPYTPPFVLRNRVKEYLLYAKDCKWNDNTNNAPLPQVFFVVSSPNMQSHIYHYAKAKLENALDDTITLFLTTRNTIQFAKDSSDIWQKVE